jgi:outer membrane protein assembly factor BamB
VEVGRIGGELSGLGWSTPMIWKHDRGTDLVGLGDGRVYCYDPTTGAERWYVSGFPTPKLWYRPMHFTLVR